MNHTRRLLIPVLAAVLAVLASCGDDDAGASAPSVVVTTSILGDVVETLVGEQADVVTIMSPGADPHTFQASARQAATMASADAVIVNGAGFEEGLRSVVDNAAAGGVPVHEAIDAVDVLGNDPHFFTDPLRMAEAVRGISAHLRAEIPALDDEELQRSEAALVADLEALDAELSAILAGIAEEDRVLVTDHGVFAYFADRYGFEVVGTVVPAGSHAEGVSGGALAELARLVRETGVPAVFTSGDEATELAEALADEAGDVEVVPLFAESLGPPGSGGETYRAMMRTNAERIADALGT